MQATETHALTFEQWMVGVNEHLDAGWGLDTEVLPTADYRSMWERGLTPDMAVGQVLSSFFSDLERGWQDVQQGVYSNYPYPTE